MIKRFQLSIDGIVQGVGFRPHIFRLAKKYQLSGYVINTSKGVEIEIEGPEEQGLAFIHELKSGNIPPLSKILSFTRIEKEPKCYNDFRIYESIREEGNITLISPDIALCEECRHELHNPSDRRYKYPFINCTNCGPRYTITKSLPYDRKNTVMSEFTMCDRCRNEYEDPQDRRFHAQPDACFECGPHVELLDRNGKLIDKKDAVEKAMQLLQQGNIVAIKGLGGFHLAVDASNEESIRILREHKGREEKPFALMVKDLESAKKFCIVSEMDKHFLMMPQRPIVLVEKKDSRVIAPNVAPHNKYCGVLLPYTPLHSLIVEGSYPALVMTSANIYEEPICSDNEEAVKRMKGIADYFLVHNRQIHQRCDDSVIALADAFPIIIRRSRGYAPEPIILPLLMSDAIAVGAHLKNTVCLGKNDRAFVSQHIGDLETYETYNFFQESIQHLIHIFEARPEIIIHDLHPGYLSTQWAKKQSLPLVAVQHHEAHVASCMAEHHLNEEVIGISFDGTGYGEDGKIWGSEFFAGKPGNFRRCAHFDYIEMAGGDLAAKEPWRMAVSYLNKYLGKDWLNYHLPLIETIGMQKIQNLISMIEHRINCPETCGCGRLFDAVSSLSGLRYMNNYEGQAPMELEMQMEDAQKDTNASGNYYHFDVNEGDNIFIVSFARMFSSIMEDSMNHVNQAMISVRFHNTIIEVMREMCHRIKSIYQINNVVMSGGCFQNRYLLKRAITLLQDDGFNVFYHQQVPPNDGGISLGQIYTYALINKGTKE